MSSSCWLLVKIGWIFLIAIPLLVRVHRLVVKELITRGGNRPLKLVRLNFIFKQKIYSIIVIEEILIINRKLGRFIALLFNFGCCKHIQSLVVFLWIDLTFLRECTAENLRSATSYFNYDRACLKIESEARPLDFTASAFFQKNIDQLHILQTSEALYLSCAWLYLPPRVHCRKSSSKKNFKIVNRRPIFCHCSASVNIICDRASARIK